MRKDLVYSENVIEKEIQKLNIDLFLVELFVLSFFSLCYIGFHTRILHHTDVCFCVCVHMEREREREILLERFFTNIVIYFSLFFLFLLLLFNSDCVQTKFQLDYMIENVFQLEMRCLSLVDRWDSFFRNVLIRRMKRK